MNTLPSTVQTLQCQRLLEEKNQAVTGELASRFKPPRGFRLKLKLPGDQPTRAATGSTADEGAAVDNTETEKPT